MKFGLASFTTFVSTMKNIATYDPLFHGITNNFEELYKRYCSTFTTH